MTRVAVLVAALVCATAVATAQKWDLCSTRRCSTSTQTVGNDSVGIWTTTEFTTLSNTFVIFTNCTYAPDPTSSETINKIDVATTLYNVTSDLCSGGRDCWMRVRLDAGSPVSGWQLGGYYLYEEAVLTLYPTLIFSVATHAAPVTFTVTWETCIVDPRSSRNHCEENIGPKSPTGLSSFARLPLAHN